MILNEETTMEEKQEPTTTIDGIEVAESERQPCEVWTRVMGYHRPISSFNIGKKGEVAERVYFEESKCGCKPSK